MSKVLVVNAGSSSVKYQLLDPQSGEVEAHGLIERIGEQMAALHHESGGADHDLERPIPDASAAMTELGAAFEEFGPDLAGVTLAAVGHRVVHGGTDFQEATLITPEVLDRLEALTPLAPLHNPANLVGIRAAMEQFPDTPHVAVFDTGFHRTLPPAAYTYAVPAQWREEFGVRRYGFHGTSHQYVSGRISAHLGRDDLATIVLHLGNGASACAVLNGESVETSMGMTPLEGLVMGTRCGDIDPAIPFHLARVAGMSAADLDTALNKSSGLKGLAGDNDFRSVNERASGGDELARLTLDVVSHRLVKYVGAYAAILGRLDALAFTGGIGEHSADLRSAVLGRLRGFGMQLDEAANAAAHGETLITTADSSVAAYVIPTNEELQIARECVDLLAH